MIEIFKKLKIIPIAILGLLSLESCENAPKSNQKVDNRPNILVIVADDLGWTDVGSFGSEIKTPNLDKLASNGTKFTDFHVSVSCSPTRSMLLSGTDNHIAGLGTMAGFLTNENRNLPGYEGYLNNNVVSLGEVMKDAGYHTYLSGKWHLGVEPDQQPAARGFEHSYSLLIGGASYWGDKVGPIAAQPVATYALDGKEIDKLPKDFYATRNYSDYLMDVIRENRGDGKPFLGLLSYTAVHDPIHVPEPWLSQYKGEYDEGYGVLKAKRAENTKRIGLISSDAQIPELHPLAKKWESLSEEDKAVEAKGMEVYAGMVSNMDYHIGRVINFLKDIGEYDNTVIIFLSDNGSNPWYSDDYPSNRGSEFMAHADNSLENIGSPNSHYAYGTGWGSAGSGPLDMFKITVGEGGIRSPMIISGPGVKKNHQVDAFSYVTDIMPTILDLAEIEHPDAYKGHKVEKMRGHSILKVLSGDELNIYDTDEIIAGEMEGGRWVRQGYYKASVVPKPYGDGEWKLFNLENDPGETNDLSKVNSDILNKLIEGWNQYADEVGVFIANK